MYTKLTSSIVTLQDIESVLLQQGVDIGLAQALMDAKAEVQINSGETAFVSCIMSDDPRTPQIDFITVAVAVKDGIAQVKPNGQYVCSVFWHGVMPDSVPVLGVSTIRKSLMMIALNEPQPTRTVIEADGTTSERPVVDIPYTADRCIKTYIDAAVELSAPLEDVL